MIVYQTPGFDSLLNTVDSIYISGTSEGQVLKHTQFVSGLLDGSVTIVLHFEGCDSINPTFYDTTIVMIPNYFSVLVRITAVWDTTTNCSYPIIPLVTDTLIWDSCFAYLSTLNTTDNLIDKKQVKIYPNPAQDLLQIEYLQEGVRPRKIQLINLNGAVVKSFEPNEQVLNIQMIPAGLYILSIEIEEGYRLMKRVIIE